MTTAHQNLVLLNLHPRSSPDLAYLQNPPKQTAEPNTSLMAHYLEL